MHWQLHRDGSYDLITPNGSILGLRAACDHRELHGQISSGGSETHGWIEHQLDDLRSVRIDLYRDSAGLRIASCLRGFSEAPGWFHPAYAGVPQDFERCFRQGVGFSGPTGCLSLGQPNAPWLVESWMLFGLLSPDHCVVMGPVAVREASFKATLRCAVERDNFRNRAIAERRWAVDLGYRLEGVALNSDWVLPEIHVRQGSDAFATLREQAQAIATHNHARVPAPSYHYCSWYHDGPYFNQRRLEEILAGLNHVDPERRVQTVQIDDGYMTSHGDWLDHKPELWPGGLAPAIAAITASGRRAGLWIAPFMVGSQSRLAAEHPDWLLHDRDGKRIVEWRRYDGASADLEHYILDGSHPDALEWIATVFRTAYAWGVRFFKTDFMEWGFKDARVVRRHDPTLTAAQTFERVMATIRAAIGEESHWLGCITYFAPSVGWCDGMRVASDVGVQWDGPGGTGNDGSGGGTANMIEESFATQYLHNVLWQNDPDVCYIRDEHVLLETAQRDALACWHGVLGGSVNTSDDLHRLTPERRAWWRFIEPGPTPSTAQLPFFARSHPHRIAVRHYPELDAWAIVVLNEHRDQRCAVVTLQDLIGIPEAHCFRWGPEGSTAHGLSHQLITDLPPRTHHLWYVSRSGEAPPSNLTLGGLRRAGMH
jgi:alpha-galactosidase